MLMAALATGGPAAAQSGIVGDWLTEGGEGKVRIAPCEGQEQQLCGRLINPKTGAFAKGSPFLTGFKSAGANRWAGGKIRHPKNGKIYNSKMALNADGSLSVSGCVLVVCQAQKWTRATSS
jgi:uncharacterized protein (DUF2147 family)